MILLSGLVDCLKCGESYEGEWADESDTVQDMDEAPVQDQVCPGCGRVQQETWPGWVNYTNPG